MIALGIAGQVVAPVPQDVPAGTDSSQGATDFLRLFERALEIGVAAQVTGGAVPEGLIGMSDAPAGEEGRTVRQGSSGMSEGKDQAERGIDPALAILVAALSPPPQGTSLEPSPGLDRVGDLPPSAMAAAPPVETTPQVAALLPPLPPQGARPAREPADAPSANLLPVEQPADSPAAIPVEIGTLLPPGAAAIPASPVQSGPLKGHASTHAKPDLPEEGAIPSATPGRVSLSPPPRPSAVSEEPETPVMAARPLLPPQGPRPTLDPAVAREALHVPLADLDQPGAQQRSGDLLFTLDARLLMTSAKAVQDGIGRSNGDQATEQVGGLPPMVTSVEGPARVSVASPEETAGSSSPPQHSAVRFSTPSDPSEVLGPEVFEREGSPELVQVGRAAGDRATMQQGSPRPEATQGIQQDRSASGSEGGSRLPDRSSPLPGDGRQLGADVALAAPPRAEELRSGFASPSLHSRALVDQVAEQVATAARLSLRNEGGHVQLRLHPQALGELVIEASWQDRGIVAAIKAQSHVAGELLASDLGRLRTALDQQGIPVSGLGVQVGLDLRHWSFEGNGFRASPAIGYAREAIPWRDRGSALPMAPAMKPDSLIDITV